jgi:hypothetical protein
VAIAAAWLVINTLSGMGGVFGESARCVRQKKAVEVKNYLNKIFSMET